MYRQGAAVHSSRSAPAQFAIAGHYDMMVELDRDVHDDEALAAAEVACTMRCIGSVPRSVYLPCFGTGRHIPALRAVGIERIVGVDLSPKCVAKARRIVGDDPAVELRVGDVTSWDFGGEAFDACVLLGNSFGDVIDSELLARVTAGMVRPLRAGGAFVMDYIGERYLDRCAAGDPIVWDAELDDVAVSDARTPSFDQESGVMTIDVEVIPKAGDPKRIWRGAYQKRILAPSEVAAHFAAVDVRIRSVGVATALMPDYYGTHTGELGMIARSTWWVGGKLG